MDIVSSGRRIASKASSVKKGAILVKVSKVFSERKARKWLWIALGALVALQIYFVQEMVAALMLFTGIFVVCAIIALVLYLVDRASRWGLGLAGQPGQACPRGGRGNQ